MQHYEEALRLARHIGDRRFEGNMRSNLGLFYQENRNFDAALDQLKAALDIARDAGLTRLAANVCCNLGLVQESLGDREGALERHREAVRLADHLRDSLLAAHFGIYLGRLLVRLGCLDEGRTRLDGVGELLVDCGDPIVLGLLACARAEVAAAGNHIEVLKRWIATAVDYLEQSESRHGSELALEIEMVSGLVSSH